MSGISVANNEFEGMEPEASERRQRDKICSFLDATTLCNQHRRILKARERAAVWKRLSAEALCMKNCEIYTFSMYAKQSSSCGATEVARA